VCRRAADVPQQWSASPRPVDAHAVAAATGRHVTTVRFHLDVLIEAGLVMTSRQQPQGRGRPRAPYAPASSDPGPRGGAYRELAQVPAADFDTTPVRRRPASTLEPLARLGPCVIALDGAAPGEAPRGPETS
jgi:hypothetical protein